MKEGRLNMLMERLKTHFELNEPIFTNEILEIMQDYSRPRIYQLINEAERNGELIHYVYNKYTKTFKAYEAGDWRRDLHKE